MVQADISPGGRNPTAVLLPEQGVDDEGQKSERETS
jgi:hypothetical protein